MKTINSTWKQCSGGAQKNMKRHTKKMERDYKLVLYVVPVL